MGIAVFGYGSASLFVGQIITPSNYKDCKFIFTVCQCAITISFRDY